jgi:hypothetical protein
MPELKPHRRELFARNAISAAKLGKSQGWAYLQSGYDRTPGAADVAACRLLKNAKVKARIAEIGRPAVKKMQFSLETLSDELAKTIEDARSKGQNSTVIRGIELGAKLHGLLTEKISVEHSLGTRAEIMESISKRFGAEAAETLAKALTDGPGAITDERRARLARDVTPEKRRIDEASPELIAGQRRD